MQIIEIANLTKVFTRGDEQIRAISDVTLTISEGDFVAITGASGSGKSTLLYILGLLDRPTSGRYLLQGTPTEEISGKWLETLPGGGFLASGAVAPKVGRRNLNIFGPSSDDTRAFFRNRFMGFIFQSFHLLPRATALRNVMMPLVYSSSYGKPIPEIEQQHRALEALAKVGLSDRVNHLPNELSGGQRQRVAIARAIVNQPRVLFADEPTGNLDSKSGKEILSLFEALNREGVTVIMVTHDNAIAQRAKRRLILVDGRLGSDSYAA